MRAICCALNLDTRTRVLRVACLALYGKFLASAGPVSGKQAEAGYRQSAWSGAQPLLQKLIEPWLRH
jgi:hypothetical protein